MRLVVDYYCCSSCLQLPTVGFMCLCRCWCHFWHGHWHLWRCHSSHSQFFFSYSWSTHPPPVTTLDDDGDIAWGLFSSVIAQKGVTFNVLWTFWWFMFIFRSFSVERIVRRLVRSFVLRVYLFLHILYFNTLRWPLKLWWWWVVTGWLTWWLVGYLSHGGLVRSLQIDER